MEKITQKQIKELIRKILKKSYNDFLELSNRLIPESENVLFQEDYLTIGMVAEMCDLIDLLLNGGDEERIREAYLENVEWY